MPYASTASVRRYVVGAAAVLVVLLLVAFRQPTSVARVVIPAPAPEPVPVPALRHAVTLEPRWLDTQGYATLDELDAATNGHVDAWQPFAWARDAGGRLAIASEPYRLGGGEPDATFVADDDGGIWRVPHAVPATGTGPWTRRIWLVPVGSAFRGDVSFP